MNGVWYGTGLSLFDESGQPQPSRGYGLGSLSMLFKAGQFGDIVQHIIGDCQDGYGIPLADRDRLVADQLRVDEMIANRLQHLKTLDGRTIEVNSFLASQFDKELEAEAIRQVVFEILSKYDGVPNFEKRKAYVAKQSQWEVQAHMGGCQTKVGWELPNKAEFYRETPLEELIEKEYWNEVVFFRVLQEVLAQICPQNQLQLVTVSGEPDMATNKYKPPYSSLDTHVAPLMEEPFDDLVECHSDIKNKKRAKFIRYYQNELVDNFEALFGDIGGGTTVEKVREIQNIVLGI